MAHRESMPSGIIKGGRIPRQYGGAKVGHASSPLCCAQPAGPTGARCASFCAARSAPSGATGRVWTSCSAPRAITARPKCWISAAPSGSTSFSASPPPARCAAASRRWSTAPQHARPRGSARISVSTATRPSQPVAPDAGYRRLLADVVAASLDAGAIVLAGRAIRHAAIAAAEDRSTGEAAT